MREILFVLLGFFIGGAVTALFNIIFWIVLFKWWEKDERKNINHDN